MKVAEITELLGKLKQSIKEMEPKVKEKTDKMVEVLAIMGEKQKLAEEVRVGVLSEKRDIEVRNREVEDMMQEVEAKIKHSEPILREANDSMLTIKRG